MSQIGALLWAKWRMAFHAVASVRNQSKLKVGVLSISAALLWLGAYWTFHAGFRWLQRFDMGGASDALRIGDIVMVRLLAVFALALLIMLAFSNILIAFSTLYRSREVTYLLQAPVPVANLFLARFVECVVFSSWASAFLGSPLILAYGVTTEAPWVFYGAAVFVYAPFVVIPAAVGAGVAMLLVRIVPRLPRGAMLILGLMCLALLLLYLRERLSVVRLSSDAFLPSLLEATGQVQSPWLPSYWASQGLLLAAQGRYADAALFFFYLVSNAAMFTLCAMALAHAIFARGYSQLAGLDRTRILPYGRGPIAFLERFLGRVRQPARALVVKDLKLFWRDPTQWSQFMIFFGLMAIYVASLSNRSMADEEETYRAWVVSLNIGACSLILSTLTSRFVFPLVSMEGRRFWIIGLAPLTLHQLVWQKVWLSVATTATFTVPLVALTSAMLRMQTPLFIAAVYCILATNFGLSGLAVGLGSLYPNFQEDNPARIISGMGGTLNFLVSMAYIGLVVAAQVILFQWRYVEGYARAESFWWVFGCVLAFVTLASCAALWIPMRLGLRNLERMES